MWPNKKQLQLKSVSWKVNSIRGGLLILMVCTVIRYGPIPTLDIANKFLMSMHLGQIVLEKVNKQREENTSLKKQRKNKIHIF